MAITMFLLLQFLLLVSVSSTSYDLTTAQEAIYLSVGTLCDKETYPTRTYVGPSAGFKYNATIYDKDTDTNGYIGVLNNKIYVAIRGTDSYENWLDDGECWMDSVDYCDDCKIHHGFHKCRDHVTDFVLSKVKLLRQDHPTYKIVSIGHSLGAAISTLLAMDIVLNGYTNVELYNFGSPRIGNDDWTTFATKKLPITYRFTHYKDPVPHLPPTHLWYSHMLNEVYENQEHSLKTCSGTEDETCMMQWHDWELNADDHSLYLNLCTKCSCV